MPPKLTVDEDYNELIRAPRLAVPGKFSCWDRIDLHGPMTLEEIIDKLKSDLNIDIDSISAGKIMLYNSFSGAYNTQYTRLSQDPISITEEILGTRFPSHRSHYQLATSQ